MKSPELPRLLIVDDDTPLRERLARAMRSRGWEVIEASDFPSGWEAARKIRIHGAVIDMRMPGGSGLDLIRRMRELPHPPKMVVVTGYGSIATALEAVRWGALDYLTKPADPDRILAILNGETSDSSSVPQEVHKPLDVPSLDRVEWEHIQRVLRDCGGNISQAARALRIDRRSLQRKLGKYPPLQ